MATYLTAANGAEGLFYVCLVGASAASAKHLLQPEAVMRELTPVAFKDETQGEKGKLHPAALWWGSYAFSIMNAGFASIGWYGVWTQSKEIKSAFMLGTGVLFVLFSAAWTSVGKITGKPDYKKQAVKIGSMGATWLLGFALSLRK